MDFEIKSVETKQDKLKFVKSQWNFYKNDPNFVPPLIVDRMKLLNTEKNPFYKHSNMKLWMAVSHGTVVGRIAAITNENHNITHVDRVGFFGFFECANDQEVANALFDKAAEWLKSQGKDAIRGPVNPSMNDECAMLLEGFDSPPVVLMPYNPKYYLDLCEKWGFTKSKDLYAYILHFEKYMSDKLKRLQGIVRERFQITIREINFKDKTQFRKDVDTLKYIYNQAWQPNWGFVKMTDEEFDFLAEDLKQIANPKLAFIVEVKGKPAGFHLGLPNINEALIYNKSGSLLTGVWHLLTKKKKMSIQRIIVLGVLPEFQKTGVDAVMYYESGMRGAEINLRIGEASWILEDNEMMNKGLTTTMLGEVYKKYRIYEKKL